MTKHLLDPQVTCNIWRQHLPDLIGKKATNLFVRQTLKQSTWLLDAIIRPALFRQSRNTYIPVTNTPKTVDRNHDFAEAIVTQPNLASEIGCDPLSAMTFFANELRIGTRWTWDNGSSIERPSERVSVGDHHVFTYEFDVKDEAFFRRQIAWVTSDKNPLDCPVGDLYKRCSRYGDFAGITVVYSGGKSLHIHVVFSTAQANASFGLAERCSSELRKGFERHWDRLHADLLSVIDADGHSADRSLKYAEAYRRLPGGIRTVGADHLLGIPEGTEIPQIVLWEKARKRAASDKLPLFFSPEAFAPQPTVRASERSPTRKSKVGRLTREQLAYCADKLRAVYPDWPRFADFVWQRESYVALFWNSENDLKPGSFMEEDFDTIALCGRDADRLEAKKLPLPLGVFMRMWCEGMPGSRYDLLPQNRSEGREDIIVLETAFRDAVRDKDTAHKAMRKFLLSTVCSADHPLMLITGPEGIGKTTTLFKTYHLIARYLLLLGEKTTGMFAFADYAAASEKCAKFNAEQQQNGFAGVVLKSFSRVYEEACDATGLQEITRIVAARSGFSQLDAIKKWQPQVIEYFREQHRRMWAEIGARVPVFFTVHQVMHSWVDDTHSRLVWAPSYWKTIEDADQSARRRLLRKEMSLGLAVHDEIKASHLVELWPIEKVQWVETLVASDPTPWCAEHSSLMLQVESYDRFVRAETSAGSHRSPLVDFDEAVRIVKFMSSAPEIVVTSDSGEYRRAVVETRKEYVDIYEACHGKVWKARERDWWDWLAQRTIVLTTEAVPAALAAASKAEWSIFSLEAPKMPRTCIDVIPKRSVTSANLPEVCADFREMHPDTFIISNKAKMITDTMPHVTARGSNELIGKNVMQTMTFMPPQLYEELQVLNAWTLRNDLVGMHHVDEVNQSAGRNLGFRHEEGVNHTLLVNRSLLKLLVKSSALSGSRYIWRPVLNKHQRSDAGEDRE